MNSIALEILQDGPVFKSAETVIKLAKNETNLAYVPSNSTSFLSVLQKIKRELEELKKPWKGQQKLVTEFSKELEEKGLAKEAALRLLDTRRKRSPNENENGFSEEIMRMIEGSVTVNSLFVREFNIENRNHIN